MTMLTRPIPSTGRMLPVVGCGTWRAFDVREASGRHGPLRDVLRSLGARPLDIVMKVGIPRSLPYFFASLKVAVTVSFVGSIVSETIGANSGVGHLIIVASSRFDVPLVFAGLMATAVMGVTMYSLASVVESRMTGWATR